MKLSTNQFVQEQGLKRRRRKNADQACFLHSVHRTLGHKSVDALVVRRPQGHGSASLVGKSTELSTTFACNSHSTEIFYSLVVRAMTEIVIGSHSLQNHLQVR